MWTSDSLHEPIIVTPCDTELFKRFLPKEMMALGGIVDAKFEELWCHNGVLLQLRKREDAARTLFGADGGRFLETGLENKFSEWSIAIQEPITIHAPGDIARPSSKAYRVWYGCPILGRDFTCVMKYEDASSVEKRFHSVEHLLHASTVVLIFLMQLAQDINYNQVGLLGLDYGFNEILAALRCHQEGEKHIILVDETQVRDIKVVPNLLQLAEALSPRGFLGVKLKIENLFWPWTRVTHHGIALRYPGGNIKCEKAFAYLWRTKKEHISGLWDEASNQPFKLGPGRTQILGGGDGTDHV